MGDGITKRRQAQLGKRAKNLHHAALTGNSVRGRLSVTNVLACYKTLRAPDMRCTSTEKQLAFAIIEKTSRKGGGPCTAQYRPTPRSPSASVPGHCDNACHSIIVFIASVLSRPSSWPRAIDTYKKYLFPPAFDFRQTNVAVSARAFCYLRSNTATLTVIHRWLSGHKQHQSVIRRACPTLTGVRLSQATGAVMVCPKADLRQKDVRW